MQIDRVASRWQDAGNFLLSIRLLFSPGLLRLEQNRLAVISGLGAAVVIGACTAVALLQPRSWESWLTAGAGLWLALSPWMLDYRHDGLTSWNHIAVGALVSILSSWALVAAGRPASRTGT